MRKELDKILSSLAENDATIILVVADLGNFKIFRSRFPERFFNVGVAESNSVGIAAGLASEGKKVFLFGIAGFTIYRAFEQIKFSVGYWNQPVCIIGTGFGWQYYQIGRGHHTADDIALMRLVPNMRIFAPIDSFSLSRILMSNLSGPCYVRIGQGISSEHVASEIPEYGSDITVVALGEMKVRCLSPVSSLRKKGFNIGLVGIDDLSISSIKEKLGDPKYLSNIVVIEDHIRLGGLGELIQDAGYRIKKHVHLPTATEFVTDAEEKLLQFYGFDSSSLESLLLESITSKI